MEVHVYVLTAYYCKGSLKYAAILKYKMAAMGKKLSMYCIWLKPMTGKSCDYDIKNRMTTKIVPPYNCV